MDIISFTKGFVNKCREIEKHPEGCFNLYIYVPKNVKASAHTKNKSKGIVIENVMTFARVDHFLSLQSNEQIIII